MLGRYKSTGIQHSYLLFLYQNPVGRMFRPNANKACDLDMHYVPMFRRCLSVCVCGGGDVRACVHPCCSWYFSG
jgi:hypothetical protein